jgi:hypothetical protein
MIQWIHSLWNSIDGVNRLFYTTQWAIAGFGILTVLATIASIKVSARKDELTVKQETAAANKAAGQLSQLSKNLAGTQKKQQETDEQIQRAQIEAAKARKAQAEAEQKIAALGPRTITPDQSEAIVATLRPFTGHNIDILIMTADEEAVRFAQIIAETISKAGWNVQLIRHSAMTIPPLYGVIIRTADPEHLSPPMKALAEALKSPKIGINPSTGPSGGADQLLIGLHPIPGG